MTTEEAVAAMGKAKLRDRLCSVIASSADQDPIGSAGNATRLLIMEMPRPWDDGFYSSDSNGTLRQRMQAIQVGYFEKLRQTGEYGQMLVRGFPYFFGIDPDKEWSRPDQRRVFVATRPATLFARYELAEYRFPFESFRLVDLVHAFFESPQDLSTFDDYRIEHGGFREFFVCTHGQVDICCGKFGVPLYVQARAAYPVVRAWRATHFGGHRFAPTAWELPSGYVWGFLREDVANHVLSLDTHPVTLAPKIRGWSGTSAQCQLLDREGLLRHGWNWLSFKRRGQILEADTEGKRWRVRLDFELPSGERVAYEGIVAVARELPEVGCGRHWGEYDLRSPEYVLTSFCTIG